MVDSVECGTNIEQGQECDLRFIYCSIDIRDAADKESFRRVALTIFRLINWEKIIYVQVMGLKFNGTVTSSPSALSTGTRIDLFCEAGRSQSQSGVTEDCEERQKGINELLEDEPWHRIEVIKL